MIQGEFEVIGITDDGAESELPGNRSVQGLLGTLGLVSRNTILRTAVEATGRELLYDTPMRNDDRMNRSVSVRPPLACNEERSALTSAIQEGLAGMASAYETVARREGLLVDPENDILPYVAGFTPVPPPKV